MVRIQGEPVRVRARIRSFDAYSGHADARGLVGWAKARGPIAGDIFLTHGEPDALSGLKQRLATAGHAPDRLIVPDIDQAFTLTAAGALEAGEPRRLASGAATALDWHNVRVELLNDIDLRMEKAASDGERRRILERLKLALGA